MLSISSLSPSNRITHQNGFVVEIFNIANVCNDMVTVVGQLSNGTSIQRQFAKFATLGQRSQGIEAGNPTSFPTSFQGQH